MLLTKILKTMFADVADTLTSEQLLTFKTEFDRIKQETELELKKASSVLASNISLKLRGLKLLNSFFDYLASITTNHSQPLLVWLLDWQLSTWKIDLNYQEQHLISVEIKDLMLALMKENKDSAIQYYQKHKALLEKASSPVKRFMEETLENKENTKIENMNLQRWLAHFNSILKGQEKSPAVILPLAIHYYQDPIAFAAILIWLLNHNVSPSEIIYSGVLHQFIGGHAAYLEDNSLNNSTYELYETLKQSGNPKANTLCEIAEKTSAYQTGTKGNEFLPGFQKYDLTGRQHTENEKGKLISMIDLTVLPSDEINFPKAEIICDQENIKNLSNAFSGTFLSLLAKSPEVTNHFTQEQWHEYIVFLSTNIGNEIIHISSWFELLTLSSNRNPELFPQIFSSLLEAVLLNLQEVLHDDVLGEKLVQLSSCQALHHVIRTKAHELIQSLDRLIRINTKDPTADKISNILSNETTLILKKLFFLDNLFNIPEFPLYPDSPFMLKALILRSYVQQNNPINEALIGSLLIPKNLSENQAQNYEKQLLLEYLIIETEENTLQAIISKLANNYNVANLWEESYEDKTIFYLAALSGNNTLIKILIEQYEQAHSKESSKNKLPFSIKSYEEDIKYRSTIDAMNIAINQGCRDIIQTLLSWNNNRSAGTYSYQINLAIKNRQWDIVKCFLNQFDDSTFPKHSILEIIKLAGEDGQWDLIKDLWRFKPQFYDFLSNMEERFSFVDAALNALKAAIINNELEFVKFVLEQQVDGSFGNEIFKKLALDIAVENQKIDIFKYLIGNKGKLELTRKDFLHSFHVVAIHGILPAVKLFSTLDDVRTPNTQEELSEIYVAAAHRLEILNYLCSLPNFSPTPTDISKAFESICGSKRDIVLESIKYFCNFISEEKLSLDSVYKGYRDAIENGHLETVAYIQPLIASLCKENDIMLAIDCSRWDVAALLCGIKDSRVYSNYSLSSENIRLSLKLISSDVNSQHNIDRRNLFLHLYGMLLERDEINEEIEGVVRKFDNTEQEKVGHLLPLSNFVNNKYGEKTPIEKAKWVLEIYVHQKESSRLYKSSKAYINEVTGILQTITQEVDASAEIAQESTRIEALLSSLKSLNPSSSDMLTRVISFIELNIKPFVSDSSCEATLNKKTNYANSH